MEDVESMLTFNTSLEELEIGKCQISPANFATLFKALPKNETLRKLTLDANHLGKLFIRLGEILKTCRLTELSVRACEISTKDLFGFLKVFSPNSPLRKLYIGSNSLEPGKFADVLKAFADLSVYFEDE